MKKTKYLIPISIALIILIGAGMFVIFKKEKSQGQTYETIQVVTGDLELTILSTGVVEPRNRLEIKPPIAGRIEEVLVVEGEKVKRGQILAWMSSTERAALIDAARARGTSELKKWSSYYKATPIISPIDGTIISRTVEMGQSFTSSDAILVMADTLSIKAQVDETDLGQIKLNEAAIVTLDAYRNQELSARVAHIAYEATTVNNVTTYAVDVEPMNPPEFMRSGMTANIRFITERREGVLLVPTEAIRIEGENYVLTPGAKGPEKKVVKIGINDGKMTEILSGLSEGDNVLTNALILNDKSSGAANPFGGPRGRGGKKK